MQVITLHYDNVDDDMIQRLYKNKFNDDGTINCFDCNKIMVSNKFQN